MIEKEHGNFLLEFARDTIENFVKGNETILPDKYPKELDQLRGVFVTLEKYPSGELRGCIGIPYPEKPLIDAVRDAACSAAKDPRFSPLKKEELDKITIEVSILTEPEKIDFSSPRDLLEKIKPNVDGMIIEKGWNSGLFLPQVWEKIPDKKQFMENLSYKAYLPPDAWKDSSIYRFRVKSFKEKEPGKN